MLIVLILLLSGCKNQQKPDGELKVRLRPTDAKVKIIPQKETQGILPVRIEIKDYGTFGKLGPEFKKNRRLRNKKTLQVGISLRKSGFLSQHYEIYKPVSEATIKLPRFSLEKDNIKDSFRRASVLYNMQLFYPTHIPAEFKLKNSEFIGSINRTGMQGMLFLQWISRKPVKGSRPMISNPNILMRFLKNQPIGDFNHRGATPSSMKISEKLQAQIYDHIIKDAVLKVNGQENIGDILFEEIPKKEMIKMVKGIRLVSVGLRKEMSWTEKMMRTTPVSGTRLDSIAAAEKQAGYPIKVPQRLFGKDAQVFFNKEPGGGPHSGVNVVYSSNKEPTVVEPNIYIFPNPGLTSFEQPVEASKLMPNVVAAYLREHKGLPGSATEKVNSFGLGEGPRSAVIEWTDNGIIYSVRGPLKKEKGACPLFWME